MAGRLRRNSLVIGGRIDLIVSERDANKEADVLDGAAKTASAATTGANLKSFPRSHLGLMW